MNGIAPPLIPWVAEPSAPEGRYNQEYALNDLPGVAYALHLFLASHMVESEEYCHKCDPVTYVRPVVDRRPNSASFSIVQRTVVLFDRYRVNSMCQVIDVI